MKYIVIRDFVVGDRAERRVFQVQARKADEAIVLAFRQCMKNGQLAVELREFEAHPAHTPYARTVATLYEETLCSIDADLYTPASRTIGRNSLLP